MQNCGQSLTLSWSPLSSNVRQVARFGPIGEGRTCRPVLRPGFACLGQEVAKYGISSGRGGFDAS